MTPELWIALFLFAYCTAIVIILASNMAKLEKEIDKNNDDIEFEIKDLTRSLKRLEKEVAENNEHLEKLKNDFYEVVGFEWDGDKPCDDEVYEEDGDRFV